MQNAVSVVHNGLTLRGMEHIPEGDGKFPAVVLFHGFTGQKLEPHRFFLKISRSLENMGVASFRFDFSGSGESDGDFENMTVLKELDEARTIFQFVQSHPSVDENKVIVLGFSMGGLVASLLAGERQSEIHKLILLAPAGTMAKGVERWVHEVPYIESHQVFDLGGNLVGKAFYEELQTIEVWNQAAKYPNQVLLIHGSEDQAVPVEVSTLYIENCYQDHASLRIIEGADHTFNKFEWEHDVIKAIKVYVGE
jgi:alpha/beta superfamily hydrolase